jgi:hypothetical protein
VSRHPLSVRLLAALVGLGVEVPDGWVPARCYTSPAQRAAGAWSWTLEVARPVSVPLPPPVRYQGAAVAGVGSLWPMGALLRVPPGLWDLHLHMGDLHVDMPRRVAL